MKSPDLGKVQSSALEILKSIPEEQVWLDSLKTKNTRRAYQTDVAHFVSSMGIGSSEELYLVNYSFVIYWEKQMREVEMLEPSTIRRKLSALSSLFSHLVKQGVSSLNPVREIKRPEVDRSQGKTLAFSKKEARMILDAPTPDTLLGKRDRAILSVGLQVGFRREEIANLSVDALHRNQGFSALWVRRKRKRDRQSVLIHPQAEQRIRTYLEASKHGADFKGALFRPVRNNGIKGTDNLNRFLDAEAPDRILRKYARLALGITKGYSAHSMRSTFTTHALANGAELEEVQRALGHQDISTTKLYDRRGHNPEKAASFFANY